MAADASTALLLEDEPLISLDLQVTLEEAGFDVSTVMSCLEAHSWLDRRYPDIVIVDIELSDGPATEIASRLIEADIPFIVHSADHPSLHSKSPFAHGAWVGKPADPEDLIEATKAAIAA